MDSRQERDQFVAELKRRGLPRAYIERLLAELDDHIADLQDERNSEMNTARKPESAVESQSADVVSFQERIGDPAQLAQFAEQQYRNRSFLGRHPIFTFLLLPLPLIILGVMTFALTVGGIGYLVDHFWIVNGFEQPFLLGVLVAIVFWGLIVFPPLGATLLLCRIARRNCLKSGWAIVSCILISLYCSQLFILLNPPPTPGPDSPQIICVGLEFYPTSLSRLAHGFAPKFGLAMGIGLLLVKRATTLRKVDEERAETGLLRLAA